MGAAAWTIYHGGNGGGPPQRARATPHPTNQATQGSPPSRLLAMTGTADVVDAVVVTVALRNNAVSLTGDPDDMKRLLGASGREELVVAV